MSDTPNSARVVVVFDVESHEGPADLDEVEILVGVILNAVTIGWQSKMKAHLEAAGIRASVKLANPFAVVPGNASHHPVIMEAADLLANYHQCIKEASEEESAEAAKHGMTAQEWLLTRADLPDWLTPLIAGKSQGEC